MPLIVCNCHFIVGHRQPCVAEINVSAGDSTPEDVAESYAYNGAVSRIANREYGAIVPAHSRRPRQSTRSFFAIFSERPMQRRYYQNATNLVRRISQSRLFLNSSRANRNELSRAREVAINQIDDCSTSRTPTTQHMRNVEGNQSRNDEHQSLERGRVDGMMEGGDALEHGHDDELNEASAAEQPLHMSISVRSLNVCSMMDRPGGQYRRNGARAFASAVDLTRSNERGETPPPPYTDAVDS